MVDSGEGQGGQEEKHREGEEKKFNCHFIIFVSSEIYR